MSARIGHRPLQVTPHDLGVDSHPSGHNGCLVVVGSYVPKTTTQVKCHSCSVQVEELRAQCGDFLETITVSSPNFYTSILSQLVKLVLLLFLVRFLVVP